MSGASFSVRIIRYTCSEVLNCAITSVHAMLRLFPTSSNVRKCASHPMPVILTSYASPSPELYKEIMKSGSVSSLSSSKSVNPGIVDEIGCPISASCSTNVQSACGLLCQGHHTVSPAPISDAAAPAHAAITDPSIKASPNLAGPRLDHAGLVAIQFRRGPGGSPNAARRIPSSDTRGGERHGGCRGGASH